MPPDFTTIDAFLSNAGDLLNSAGNAIISSFPPYDQDVYNSIPTQPSESEISSPNTVNPPSVPPADIPYVNRRTSLRTSEGSAISYQGSNFWFKGLKGDIDWNALTEDDITINYDLNEYISPFSPEISGIWRPCILYTDPIEGEKNTNINYSFSGDENDCEAGLGLEDFISISSPVFKTWELDAGLSVKIDWTIPKDFQTCNIMGILFWYRHYDVGRETNIVQEFSINATPKQSAASNISLSSQTIRIDGKVITLKAQHEDHVYNDAVVESDSANEGIVLYGIQEGLHENDYVLVNRMDGNRTVSKDIYKVTPRVWECIGPPRFLPGVDIYLADGFFTIDYDSYALVKIIKGEDPSYSEPDPLIEFYPKTKLIIDDQAKYRGALTSLVNLSNNITLEQIMVRGGLGTTEENEPIHYFMNKEERNLYIGLKNLARMLATGPLVDMAAVYAYNKFNEGIDLGQYLAGNFAELKTRIEDVYGKLVRSLSDTYQDRITSNIYNLPSGFFTDDELEIQINGLSVSRDQWIKIDNSTIEFTNDVQFNREEGAINTISINKFLYINDVMTNQNPFFGQISRSLYNYIEDNDIHSIQNNLRLIKTKKDLALALTIYNNAAQNFYLKFDSGKNAKIRSKKNIDVGQVYIKLNFESKRPIGTESEDFWYKQRFNVRGTDLYTKLKVPDDSEFDPGERESLLLSITDSSYTRIESTENKIIIFDWIGFDINQSQVFNSVLSSVFDAFGISQIFDKVINLEKAVSTGINAFRELYMVGVFGSQNYIMKSLNDWTYEFDKAVHIKKEFISSLKNKVGSIFNHAINLLEDRFLEVNSAAKSIYPEIKEVYFHRLGGILLPNTQLFTNGPSIYWNYHTSPVKIQDAQYFIKEIPDLQPSDYPNKILIEFECNSNLHIRLYEIEIENLRIDTYESSGYRPFPNKTPVRSDETRVYDKVIGYEFNEDNYLLTTQFSPPIIAYGGHRKEDIESLGLNIIGHPQPIEKNQRTGLYEILENNTLPFTAKNSVYKTPDIAGRTQALREFSGGPVRDKSSVKCFLAPNHFYNEITFTKGFFHPNIGWLDYNNLGSESSQLLQRTPVIESGISNCKTYGSYGKKFVPELLTDAQTIKPAPCLEDPGYTGGNNLIILDPAVAYKEEGVKEHRVWPNIITTNINNDVNFISFISAKLSFLNHPFPKDLRISLFDPREYRFIAGHIVDKTMEYTIHVRKCTTPPPGEEEIKKLEDLRKKEWNSWVGPLAGELNLLPRHLLYNTTLLNYKPNFNLIFNNYGRDLKYAATHNIVLPEDSFDYYIGSSGIVRGFGEFDLDETLVSQESDNTWGIQISDMGGLDSGSTCFQLQVCTGCPVPNYQTVNGSTGIAMTPYNILAYNNHAFNDPYPSGYCFIGDFTNLKHLIPPINLEAPYDGYNREIGDFPCIEEPDPPAPREYVKPIPEPEPVFIPPIHFPLIGLLTEIANMTTMHSLGYSMPFGALVGVYMPNPYTENVTLRKKNAAYLLNKGYLQVEGTTASYLRAYGYIKGLSLSKDYAYGIPNKVELEIKYRNCLWYTIEADIFKYSPQCSPVLENTKFKYLLYDQANNYPGFDFTFKLLPAGDITEGVSRTGEDRLVVDGARPFYSFMNGESIELIYRVLRPSGTPSGATVFIEVETSGTFTINDINIPKLTNPQYVPSTIDNSFFNENNDIEGSASPPLTDREYESQFLPGTVTLITLSNNILGNGEKFVSGFINKTQRNTVMLHKAVDTEHDRMIPFGKWGNVDNLNVGHSIVSSIKDQLFSEGSYGWGSQKINPETHPLIKTQDLLGLHNFDYHFGKADYCGRLKMVKNDGTSRIVRMPYNPRLKYENMQPNPHAQSINNEYIVYTGYPTHIKNIPNRIYSHNIFSISAANQKLYDFYTDNTKYGQYYYDKLIAQYYLPYYDLTLDPSLVSGFLEENSSNYILIPSGQDLPSPGTANRYYKKELSDIIYRWNSVKSKYEDVSKLTVSEKDYLLEDNVMANGFIQFENIFSRVHPGLSSLSDTRPRLHNDNYYWISIPANASGVLASTSKIPYSIKQECDYLGANWASMACQNVCNTSFIGPLTLEDAQESNPSYNAQNLAMFYTQSDSNKCPGVNYELRETTQNFYMGCGELKNDSTVRLDLEFKYYVPVEAHAFISARDLLENNNEIKVRFKYLPRKIQTDFTITLGTNAVNQSQLYFWECHRTNVKNIYTEATRLSITPPFYQVLNEMIFRAWFGERQKISTQDIFGVDNFMTQNHYKWVPYEYDATHLFDLERESLF